MNYLRPSFLCHLNLATSANFWKSLNLSGAKIKILLFFCLTFRANGRMAKKIKHIMTKKINIAFIPTFGNQNFTRK